MALWSGLTSSFAPFGRSGRVTAAMMWCACARSPWACADAHQADQPRTDKASLGVGYVVCTVCWLVPSSYLSKKKSCSQSTWINTRPLTAGWSPWHNVVWGQSQLWLPAADCLAHSAWNWVFPNFVLTFKYLLGVLTTSLNRLQYSSQ